jgi:hypothetical protein
MFGLWSFWIIGQKLGYWHAWTVQRTRKGNC